MKGDTLLEYSNYGSETCITAFVHCCCVNDMIRSLTVCAHIVLLFTIIG